jgi:hypothetical protein
VDHCGTIAKDRPPGARRPARRGSHTATGLRSLIALIATIVLLSAVPASSAQTHAAAPLAVGVAVPMTYLNGTVVWGTNLTGLSGTSVQLYNATRVALGSAVASGTGGTWSFSVPLNANYFVVAANSSTLGEGGGWTQVAVGVSPSTGNLLQVWPLVPYDNASFVLPDYVNLSAYSDSPGHLQEPMLSWESDNVLYIGSVNGTLKLLNYSLVNQSVRAIANWTALDENMMAYAGWLNNAFLTEDGSWVYEFGCPKACTATGPFWSYAVNLTTGSTYAHNWTTLGTLPHNPQVQIDMVGLAGNLSTEIVLVGGDPSHPATAHAYDIWNESAWTAGTLPFFEANNVYWVPQLESYFDVEAGGYGNDTVAQVRLGGSGDGSTLTTVYTGSWGSGGDRINFVQGVFFNVTGRTLTASGGYNNNGGGAQLETFTYDLAGNGTISGVGPVWTRSYSCKVCGQEIPTVESDEHRPMTVATGPALAAEYTDLFGLNNSWLVDPASSAGFASTNQSLFGDNPLVTSSGAMNQGGYDARPDSALDGQFVNASRMIAPASLDCLATAGKVPCPIQGTAAGTTVGTVYYLWDASTSEFAFPASSGLAQDGPPGPLAVTVQNNSTAVQASWSAPSNDDPALNYTVSWNTTNGSTVLASGSRGLPPTSERFAVASAYGDRTCLSVVAWNLHWHDAPATVCGGSLLGPPGPPTDLRVDGTTLSSATIAWDPAVGIVSNYTLFYGPSCSSLETADSGINGTAYTILGLNPGSAYCAETVAVNPAGPSAGSRPLNFTTSSPSPSNGFIDPGWGTTLPTIGPGGASGPYGTLTTGSTGTGGGSSGLPCPAPPCGTLGGSTSSGSSGGPPSIHIPGLVLTPVAPASGSGGLRFTPPDLAVILAGIAIGCSGRFARRESRPLGDGLTVSGIALALVALAIAILV